MQIEATAIPDVKIVTPKRFGDARGWFSETWSRKAWTEAGFEFDFVQDNHSYSAEVGVIRGLHFQTPPFAQAKLVRVTRGRIRDIAVDLRAGSPTYGLHVAVELSAQDGRQLLVPVGFAHGFCTLTPDCEVLYKVSNVYAPAHDKGLAFDDPALGIDWGVDLEKAVLSEKDRRHPRLAELGAAFA
jgi:dTDP-4-dehydrorhamnose 3,5-epimerase